MCTKRKRVRQFLELASALFGLVAAMMYFQEIRESIREDSSE
jgi:hypothetical protein